MVTFDAPADIISTFIPCLDTAENMRAATLCLLSKPSPTAAIRDMSVL